MPVLVGLLIQSKQHCDCLTTFVPAFRKCKNILEIRKQKKIMCYQLLLSKIDWRFKSGQKGKVQGIESTATPWWSLEIGTIILVTNCHDSNRLSFSGPAVFVDSWRLKRKWALSVQMQNGFQNNENPVYFLHLVHFPYHCGYTSYQLEIGDARLTWLTLSCRFSADKTLWIKGMMTNFASASEDSWSPEVD